jgi:uncharacterized protein (DUF2141 family)
LLILTENLGAALDARFWLARAQVQLSTSDSEGVTLAAGSGTFAPRAKRKGKPPTHKASTQSAALQKTRASIVHTEATCRFDAIPCGTYAVACFHDENDNGKLDTGLFGIPKEGTVVSNHAKGFMGPPSFDAAKFSFSAHPTEVRLRMGY